MPITQQQPEFFPGQLLQAMESFSVFASMHDPMPDSLILCGDTFFLLSIESTQNTPWEVNWQWRTTVLTSTGNIAYNCWWEKPFVDGNGTVLAGVVT